jgi:hypothetical protein
MRGIEKLQVDVTLETDQRLAEDCALLLARICLRRDRFSVAA